MDSDAPFGSPHKSFGSQMKKSTTDSMGVPIADGKKLQTSSSSNSNSDARQFTAEEEQEHKNGCIATFRDVKVMFFILMLCGLVLFLVVPVISLMSLSSLHNQMNTLLPAEVARYINYFTLVLDVDEMDVLVDYYTYLGEADVKKKLMEKVDTATSGVLSLLNDFCSVMENCEETDATTLNTSYTTFIETAWPAFESDVADRLSTLKSYAEQSSLRDTLFNALVTKETQAEIARGSFMIANAKLACYSIDKCWSSSDVQSFFGDVENAVGNLLGSLTAALNDMFSVIEDPRLGETTAAGVISANTDRNTKRTALISSVSSYYTAAVSLLDQVKESSSVTAGLEPLFFVLPPDWASTLATSLNQSQEFALSMNTKFLNEFGITSTATTGVEDALALNISQAEVMSLVQSLNSYFGYDIGTGLTMSVTDEEQQNIYNSFNNSVTSYIMKLRQQVVELYDPTYNALGSLVYSEDKLEEQAIILKMSVSACVICSLASFGFYLAALIIVRYYLPESPLPFSTLLIMVACLYVLQVGISILAVVRAAVTPLQTRQFTYDFLLNLNSQCRTVAMTVSKITRQVVKGGLLISPDYDTLEASFDSFSEALVRLSAEFASESWYSSFFSMAQIIQNLLGAGFYPLRQGFTAASSLGFTSAALVDVFGITGVEGAPATTPESCQILNGASAMAQLNSNYYSLSAIRERISMGKVSLNQNSLASEFASATLETACLISYVLYENGQKNCYDASTCSEPGTYGMLRSTSETDSMYSIFDPFSTTGLGELFVNVKTLRLGLYDELDNLFDQVRSASEKDASSVELARRLIVWASILTFGVLLAAVLVLRALVFGHSMFSMFA